MPRCLFRPVPALDGVGCLLTVEWWEFFAYFEYKSFVDMDFANIFSPSVTRRLVPRTRSSKEWEASFYNVHITDVCVWRGGSFGALC